MRQEDRREPEAPDARRRNHRPGAEQMFLHHGLPDTTSTLGAVPAKGAAGAKILVIEGDRVTRDTLALMLSYYGYDVAVAGSGTEATALLAGYTPDLVVMDWRMPGLSGLCLCLSLRRRWPMLPIVVVTSRDEVFDGERPVNAWLRKPIDAPLLHRVIRDELAPVRSS